MLVLAVAAAAAATKLAAWQHCMSRGSFLQLENFSARRESPPEIIVTRPEEVELVLLEVPDSFVVVQRLQT